MEVNISHNHLSNPYTDNFRHLLKAGFRELELDAEAQLKDLIERTRTGEKKTTHRTVFEEMLDGYADPHPEDLVHEAVSVVGAGMHTTRWILCVGALEVARNPEVASKLAQELKEAIPDVNGSLSYQEMENLPYLVWPLVVHTFFMCIADGLW